MITASTDLLIGQWREATKLNRLIEVLLDIYNRENIIPRQRLEMMRNVDTAVGVWLDYIGERLGVQRPAITASVYQDTFGFDRAGVGFDQARFGDIEELEFKTPMGDSDFRRMVKARGHYVTSSGLLGEFVEAAREIDSTATVTDNLDMTATVTTARARLMELALEYNCLPKPVGVRVTIA